MALELLRRRGGRNGAYSINQDTREAQGSSPKASRHGGGGCSLSPSSGPRGHQGFGHPPQAGKPPLPRAPRCTKARSCSAPEGKEQCVRAMPRVDFCSNSHWPTCLEAWGGGGGGHSFEDPTLPHSQAVPVCHLSTHPATALLCPPGLCQLKPQSRHSPSHNSQWPPGQTVGGSQTNCSPATAPTAPKSIPPPPLLAGQVAPFPWAASSSTQAPPRTPPPPPPPLGAPLLSSPALRCR